MVTITNNKVELHKSCKLTQKQMHRMKSLPQDKQLQYALSCIGLQKTKIRLDKSSNDTGHDKLLSKSRNATLHTLSNLLNCESHKLHVPLSRDSKSQWIGVEIECLFEGDDNSCESCDGSGESTCYNCEGNGHISSEDSNGHTYQNDCVCCEGNGSTSCDDCNGSSDSGSEIRASIRRKLIANKITHCSVKSDGSLSGDDKVGVEVTVLFNAANGFDKLRKVCKILNSLGASINDTCGLHVHLDVLGQDYETIGYNIGQYLPIMKRLVPSSRRNNQYCELSVGGLTGGRYYAVNMSSVAKHNTIEVRLHSGTTNSDKIEHWIKLLLAIKAIQTRIDFKTDTIKGIEQTLKLSTETINYFKNRYLKFNQDLEDNEDQGDDLEVAEIQEELPIYGTSFVSANDMIVAFNGLTPITYSQAVTLAASNTSAVSEDQQLLNELGVG